MKGFIWKAGLVGLAAIFSLPVQAVRLDLTGFADDSGAISVQYRGETVDPYFVLQALLLAQDHGLDTRNYADKWAAWLLERQKPDATFDRFCKRGPVWAPCKTADADDAVLALWLKFLDSLPEDPKQSAARSNSHRLSKIALTKLLDSARGIFLVSPVYQHGLLMDNLEIWSYRPAREIAETAATGTFTRAIETTFWDKSQQRFLVSTQSEQKNTTHAFYPDAVAQIFPLMVRFPQIPGGEKSYYRQWMKRHRSEWLHQVKEDFAWGLIAIVALQQGDITSVNCWLKSALPHRNTSHWILADEVVLQILQVKGIAKASPNESCQ